MDGSRVRQKLMGLPAPKRLKRDAVPTIFPRSIGYMEDTDTTSSKGLSSRPLSEKRHQKSVSQ